MSLIEKLTPEQEALIPVYREKWRSIALSTEPIDRQKATEAVKATYADMGFQEPDIFFCDSPFPAFSTFESQLKSKLYSTVENRLWQSEWGKLNSILCGQLRKQLEWQLQRQLWKQLGNQLRIQFDNWFIPQAWAYRASEFDVYISVLNCACDRRNQRTWKAFQGLVKYCGWILPLEKTCTICDRPISFSYDSDYRLHAEEKPAIQFADGYSLYAHHGVTIPEKYGLLHPREWQASWILEEENAEVRRVLIQGIGYARVCQELQAQQLDSWAEYTLLKIDNADIEPIYLLKMTCPSTGYIHALRVPPNIQSAREAIRWVNWGIAPEEFQEQT